MEQPNRKILALASIILLAVLLSGCGVPWPFPQPTPDPKLPDSQQIFRPLESGPNNGDVDSLDPGQIQFGFDAGMAQLIFPQLVTLDATQHPVDWAAESHEISKDGLTYTFHLRKGMVWANGSPINATTFAYSMNRTLDPCLGSGVAFYLYALAGAEAFNNGACPAGAIKSTATLIGSSIQAPDLLTLRLTLAHPAGYFLSALTWPASWAVPQALIENYTTPRQYGGTRSTWTDHLTDKGPFGGNLYRLKSWQPPSPSGNGILTFERNERFWGKKPLLRRIEYTLYKDVAVEWSDFIHGGGDSAIPRSSAAGLAEARKLPSVILQRVPRLVFSYLAINWNYAPFDDLRVRQAFSLALDRQAIAHEIYQDTSQPTIHLVPEGMPGYNPDLTDAAGRKGKDALTPDLDAARALLKAYVAEKCRGSETQCPLAVINGYQGSATQADLVHLLVSQWASAFPDYPIHEQLLTRDCLTCSISTIWDGWAADYPDPQDFLSVVWATTAPHNANLSHVSVPQADTLLVQADGMSDLTARIPLYQQAEQELVSQGATIPLTQPLSWYAVRSRVAGWRIAPMGVTPLSVWQQVYIKR